MESDDNNNKYDDIINLPHHVSIERQHMSLHDRAAQFSPFAALTGYEGAIREEARLTTKKIVLDEMKKVELDKTIQLIKNKLQSKPSARITYFQPDITKDGGEYVTVDIKVKRIDTYKRCIITDEDIRISIDDITEIEGGY